MRVFLGSLLGVVSVWRFGRGLGVVGVGRLVWGLLMRRRGTWGWRIGWSSIRPLQPWSSRLGGRLGRGSRETWGFDRILG